MYPVGSKLSGTTWSMKFASGVVKAVYPGVGFLVEKDLYTYLIIDNFKMEEKPMNHHIDTQSPEYLYASISKETILMWLSEREPAKAKIYGIELREKALLHPLSMKALSLNFKLAPFIHPRLDLISQPSDILDYYLSTGVMPNCERGDHAPIPLELMCKKEEKSQLNEWHLMRAQCGITNGFTYHFLESGKLRVEVNGEKLELIHFNHDGVQKSTPYASPAFTSVKMSLPLELGEIPECHGTLEEFEGTLEDIPECHGSLEGTYESKATWNLSRLTTDQLHEGIEAAYWEIRRTRSRTSNWANDPDVIHFMTWTDNAWDEIESRS